MTTTTTPVSTPAPTPVAGSRAPVSPVGIAGALATTTAGTPATGGTTGAAGNIGAAGALASATAGSSPIATAGSGAAGTPATGAGGAGGPGAAGLPACPSGFMCVDPVAESPVGGLMITGADGKAITLACSDGSMSITDCNDADPKASCPAFEKPICMHIAVLGMNLTACGQLCSK